MPDRPSFPVPEDLTPDTFCLCLQIPNDPIWKAVISGLLFQPAEWFNWQRDEARSGKILAQYWRNIYNDIDWSIMSCCCPEPEPVIIRITPDGVYETSADGGVTWTPNPSVDPRHSQPVYPPYPAPEADNARCQYADSVVQVIKTQMIDLIEEGQSASTVINIIVSALAGLFLVLAPGLIGAIVVSILTGIAIAIIGISITAFKAAITAEVYNRLRCNLYSHMNSDGSFSAAGKDAVYAQIGTDETGLTALFLQGVVAAAGEIGLSNMAHAGLGSPTAECCATSEVWVTDNTGTYILLEPDGDGLYTATGDLLSSGKYYLNVAFAEDPTGCAIGNSISIVSYDGDENSYDLKLRQGDCVNDALALCYAIRQKRSSAPFTLTFTLDSPSPCVA
jgi:hypothetical protein